MEKANCDKIKNIAVLGSTGSIGRQTLDVCAEYPDRLRPSVLVAGRKVDDLARQALQWRPETVVIADSTMEQRLAAMLSGTGIEVRSGDEAVREAMTLPCVDTVVTATVGYSGLAPTLAAIDAGKDVALANKETLVVAGELVNSRLAVSRSQVIPVDSEHSAIYQCLVGEDPVTVNKLIITASGGPFRTWSREKIEQATVADALHHPNWSMGAKITIDSASMMNKGFEVIEAKWLFDLTPEQIEVVVHPQSVVHSAVQFADGAVKAQLGVPDMRVPIQLAFSYPERLHSSFDRLDFCQASPLTFERPDTERFRNLALAYEAMRRGGNMPCILNAANEVVNRAFLEDRVGFLQMSDLMEQAMSRMSYIAEPTLEDYLQTDAETRALVSGWL